MSQIKEDMHVHSVFSDGVNTIPENLAFAEEIGLSRICCVDHVRASTDWVPDFVAAVESARNDVSLEVFSGVEAKMLDTKGTLDLPLNIEGVDFIYAADHQFPAFDGPRHPREIRQMLSDGSMTRTELITEFLLAVGAVIEKHQNLVLAHLFSIFPKCGLHESEVTYNQLVSLADKAKLNGAILEVDERWKCPSVRTVQIFQDRGVGIFFSSDSHRKETIGKYIYNERLDSALENRQTA